MPPFNGQGSNPLQTQRNQDAGSNYIGSYPPASLYSNTPLYYFYYIPYAISSADRLILEGTV